MKIIITLFFVTSLVFTGFSQSVQEGKQGWQNIIDIVYQGDSIIAKTHHLLIKKDAISSFKRIDSITASKKYGITSGEDVYEVFIKNDVKLYTLQDILEAFNIPIEKRKLPVAMLYNVTPYSSEVVARLSDVAVLLKKDTKSGAEYLSIVYYPWWRFADKETFIAPDSIRLGPARK